MFTICQHIRTLLPCADFECILLIEIQNQNMTESWPLRTFVVITDIILFTISKLQILNKALPMHWSNANEISSCLKRCKRTELTLNEINSSSKRRQCNVKLNLDENNTCSKQSCKINPHLTDLSLNGFTYNFF